jgi:ketohexokinase
MARVLCVGVAVLDAIHQVARFPHEDEEIRANGRRFSAGGNAANTAQALAALGYEAALAAVCARDSEALRLEALLHAAGVDTAHCVHADHGATPASFIISVAASGTRSIVHFRDLREYGFDEFARIPADDFDWIHFEGRNVPETLRMLEHLRATGYRGRISVEAEKPREGIETLFSHADLVMMSRAFAAAHRWDVSTALEFVHGRAPRALGTCTRGVEGAVARDGAGTLHWSPGFPPEHLVETVGAGDAFNAGLIHSLLIGMPPPAALENACKIAGRKVGREGFAGLAP